jgi:hypothetical protein
MSRVLKLAGGVLSTVILASSIALAALPNPGVFKGESTENAKVRIEANTKHNIKVLKVTEPASCENFVHKFEDVKIKDNGTFKAVEKFGDTPVFTITGNFVKKWKAKGTISQTTCAGKDATYVARRQ